MEVGDRHHESVVGLKLTLDASYFVDHQNASSQVICFNFLDIQINRIVMIPVLISEDYDDDADDERDPKISLGAA